MSTKNSPAKYTEEFKKTIVSLYQSGKTYAQIQKEYGVSSSALSNWIRKYSQVKVDDNTILSAQQIKALQKRNAELEEENLILKKAIAIFTPHSGKDETPSMPCPRSIPSPSSAGCLESTVAPTISTCGINPPADSRRMWSFGSGYWSFMRNPTSDWARRRWHSALRGSIA